MRVRPHERAIVEIKASVGKAIESLRVVAEDNRLAGYTEGYTKGLTEKMEVVHRNLNRYPLQYTPIP